jgi:hypothetical protein
MQLDSPQLGQRSINPEKSWRRPAGTTSAPQAHTTSAPVDAAASERWSSALGAKPTARAVVTLARTRFPPTSSTPTSVLRDSSEEAWPDAAS